MLFLPLFLMIFSAQAHILPEIFYAPKNEKEVFCANLDFQKESFWRSAVDKKISSLIKDRGEVVQNSYVSLSYLELFKTSSKHQDSQFMGYVYANASHHLGRLVRFHKWPSGHPLKKADQSLVKGSALRLAVYAASNELSSRLMSHSLALYKELMWNLLPASICGAEYTLGLINDPDLLTAFTSDSTEEFIEAYVIYEQSYLQRTMYSDWMIGPSAKSKVLDEMRFISFNGKVHPSFQEWCAKENCQTSSYDLTNRILFDSYSILNEYHLTQGLRDQLQQRAQNATIEKTANAFLSRNRY